MFGWILNTPLSTTKRRHDTSLLTYLHREQSPFQSAGKKICSHLD